MSYIPGPGQPQNLDELWRYLRGELQKIQQAFSQLETIARVYNAPPRKPAVGQIVVADGTNWNPVGGAASPKLVGWSGSAWIEIKIFT